MCIYTWPVEGARVTRQVINKSLILFTCPQLREALPGRREELPDRIPTVMVQLSRYVEPLPSPGFRGLHAWQLCVVVRSSLSISRPYRAPGPCHRCRDSEAASEVSGLNLASPPNRTAGASSHRRRPCGKQGWSVSSQSSTRYLLSTYIHAYRNYRVNHQPISKDTQRPTPAHHHTIASQHTTRPYIPHASVVSSRSLHAIIKKRITSVSPWTRNSRLRRAP